MSVSTLATAVEHELTTFFASRRAQTTRVDPLFTEAARALEEFVLRGGKRVRPSFAWWGWRGAGGDPDGPEATRVLRACSALELIQACALVHDDLMDDSDTRRGFPTVHTEFTQRHRDMGWHGDAERFGLAAAVLLGDLALAWADDMLRAADLPAPALARALPFWESMRTEMLGGQYLDVSADARRDETPEAALRIDRFKTAAYTIERPLHLGGALAGGSPEMMAAYSCFGADIGVAFQLRDDLLGVFGDPEVTGKPAGDDLREGKRTLLVALALQRADATEPATAALLRRSLGRTLDADTIAELRRALVRLGAVDEVEQRITELTASGLAAMDTDLVEPLARKELQAMAESATSRSY
ncbi:polyprenyl synthetase family protein [Rhodococcus sp. X156]|uniref:polyprenyl synthetase family protein n=1 Tax=Rhodococcus sp. X156 TaxID=2499145 RepID=UPI000FD86E95|nr:polyprenyl synthetase family protein [Rhodococcus sp. X156]